MGVKLFKFQPISPLLLLKFSFSVMDGLLNSSDYSNGGTEGQCLQKEDQKITKLSSKCTELRYGEWKYTYLMTADILLKLDDSKQNLHHQHQVYLHY